MPGIIAVGQVGLAPKRTRVGALVAALCLAAAAGARGQTVRGRVVEADTRKPVAGARVVLRSPEDSSLAAVTDTAGAFVARATVPGRYEVSVARLGYRAQQQGPFELLTVTVAAEVNSRFLQTVGFYDRKRSDFGHFITRDEIESKRASRPTDLLRVLPGVSLIPDPRSPGRVRVQMRGTHPAQGGACAPRVFVDGLIAIRGDSRPPRPGTASAGDIEDVFENDPRNPEPALDDIVTPEQIQAIEVYRSASQVPAEFGGASVFTRCGVVVVWTRRGR